MSLFVSNFNNYLTTMKIKQNYICRKSGIDENKLSRILTGKQEETGSDMEKLCNAIGKKISFFTNENFCLETVHPGRNPNIRFYAGNPTGEQNKVANNLLELIENIDEVLSARECFLNMR